MNEHIYIFGSGGHGKVVASMLEDLKIPIMGFLDENPKKYSTAVLDYRVIGGLDVIKKDLNAIVALGIGDNKARGRIFTEVLNLKRSVYTVIHPTAYVSRRAAIGRGVMIMPHATVNVGVTLEDGCVINTGASVDHDCTIKKFSQVWPGAHLAGTVVIGEYSYIGTGVSVIQNITIGNNVLVGAGAAVIASIPHNVISAGVPAKIIKKR